MSIEITTAMVKQYSANVFHLSQQKGSRLEKAVRVESQKGEEAFYERIGAAIAQPKLTRHADTPRMDTPHSRRRVTMTPYNYADLIDTADKVRTLIDPTNPYVQAAVMALGRAKDDIILEAMSGSAYSGKSGNTAVAMPNTQKIASVSGTAGANLNVNALRMAKEILDSNDVDDAIPRYVALNASALRNLLAQEEVTSSDYNTVKALVNGQLDTFLGFKFIRLERLLLQDGTLNFVSAAGATQGEVGSGGGDADGYTKVIAWAGDGLLLSKGQDVMTRISERDDKNYSVQVYAEMDLGAVRMEEEKVVEILCAQS